MGTNLLDLIREYYKARNLVWPSSHTAILWAITELGEVCDLLLNNEDEAWVRNHPDDHELYTPDRYAEELGDAIMMLIVAGMVECVDPLKTLCDKMQAYIKMR